MSYFRHGDPLDGFDRIDREQCRREARLPVCENCGHPIYDEHYFEIDNEILCEECVIERYRKNTEDVVNANE